MAIGRPTKLTKEIAEAIAADVEAGLALALAAEAAGVARRTALGWLAAGRADAAAGEESLEREFAEGVATARARLGRQYAADLREGQKDHRAIAYLERTRFPDVYADAALEAAAAAELAANAPDAGDGSPGHPGAVQVEAVRCPSCGTGSATDEGRPAFCAACGAKLPGLEGAAA